MQVVLLPTPFATVAVAKMTRRRAVAAVRCRPRRPTRMTRLDRRPMSVGAPSRRWRCSYGGRRAVAASPICRSIDTTSGGTTVVVRRPYRVRSAGCCFRLIQFGFNLVGLVLMQISADARRFSVCTACGGFNECGGSL